jgi:N6-L-threonylcarbamoyladenine synthase
VTSPAALRACLAIETSCDDTSAAVVDATGWVLAVASANQNQAHRPFGGVVPEVASRNHTARLLPLVDQAIRASGLGWAGIDGIAVTYAPGLIGSLLVGVVAAKTLALALEKPFIGVNHLEGHLLAPFLSDGSYAAPKEFAYPFAALAISGGHTSLYRVNALGDYEVLGRAIDDAAGEAFDKFAKMAGLGFPGGPRVDSWAAVGDPSRFAFPRAMLREPHFNFSFSGLKAAASREIASLSAVDAKSLAAQAGAAAAAAAATEDGPVADGPGAGIEGAQSSARSGVLADLCASFQAAVIDVLLARLARAVREEKLSRAALTGGVSANSALRARAAKWAAAEGIEWVGPPLRYCTDNAAMIGYAGILRLNAGERSAQGLGPLPRAPLGRLRPSAVGPRLASAAARAGRPK